MKLYELFIGFRYLKSKKSQGFISFNTLLSILIVFLGVFILIVVISVLNGFQAQIKDKILDVDSHVTITRSNSEIYGMGMKNYKELVKRVEILPGIKSVTPFIQGQGLFRLRTNISYVIIRGIGTRDVLPDELKKFIVDRNGKKFYQDKQNKKPANNSNPARKKIIYRDRYGTEFFDPPPYPDGIFIGYEMSKNYNLFIGDYVEIIVPKGRLNVVTGVTPGLGTYRVRGFFKTGYYDYDTKLVAMSLKQSQQLFEVGDIVWGIGAKINDVYKMNQMARQLFSALGADYVTMTAEEKNQNLFYALKLEKLIMTIILFLVIISAGFTIMGTIVMVIMEKRKSIGILKSMGAKLNSIMIIFVMEGFIIGLVGALSGVILGLATALNLEAIILWIELIINRFLMWVYSAFSLGLFTKVSIVPTHVYYIDSIPTEIKPEFVVFIAIFAVFLSTVASIFPAWHASRLNPVDTIRYE